MPVRTVLSWSRVTRQYPCPYCGRPDWCSRSSAGEVICWRSSNAHPDETSHDKRGVPYVRLPDPAWQGETSAAATEPPPRAAPAERMRAGPEVLDLAYRTLLAHLALDPIDREGLSARGLTDAQIDAGLYRTMPTAGPQRAAAADAVAAALGQVALDVPGLALHQIGEKDVRALDTSAGLPQGSLALLGPPGLMIPVIDTAGRVVAIKIRTDGPSRYIYLTSRRAGGAGPGAQAHIAGTIEGAPCIRITEGELKATIAYHLTGIPTVSVPGVSAWRTALALVVDTALRGTVVRIAYDADAATNPLVAESRDDLADALARAGFAVEIETWNSGKGIDDALVAGETIERVPRPKPPPPERKPAHAPARKRREIAKAASSLAAGANRRRAFDGLARCGAMEQLAECDKHGPRGIRVSCCERADCPWCAPLRAATIRDWCAPRWGSTPIYVAEVLVATHAAAGAYHKKAARRLRRATEEATTPPAWRKILGMGKVLYLALDPDILAILCPGALQVALTAALAAGLATATYASCADALTAAAESDDPAALARDPWAGLSRAVRTRASLTGEQALPWPTGEIIREVLEETARARRKAQGKPEVPDGHCDAPGEQGCPCGRPLRVTIFHADTGRQVDRRTGYATKRELRRLCRRI